MNSKYWITLRCPMSFRDDFDAKMLNILVVDDSPPILKMTSMMLRKNGHIVTIAEDGYIHLQY